MPKILLVRFFPDTHGVYFFLFFGVIIPDCQLPKFTENTHKIAQIAYKMSKNCLRGGLGGGGGGKGGET